MQVLRGHVGNIGGTTRTLACSTNSGLLASGWEDGTIRIWNLSTGAALQRLYSHTEIILSVAFSQDGKLLVSASGDHTLKLWDLSLGEVLYTEDSFAEVVKSVVFSGTGRLIATICCRKAVKV
jgi:WD40 repeat protein